MERLNNTDARALRAVQGALAPLQARITVHESPTGPRLIVDVAERTYVLAPVWAGEGFPQDVQVVANNVHPRPELETLVVVARQMSSGAMQWLEQRGYSWADLQGRARIVSPPGLAIVTGATRTKRTEGTSFTWSPSAGAVAEYLLTSASVSASTAPAPFLPATVEMASILSWSPAQISNVLRAFDNQGWTRKEGSLRGPGARRTLRDPTGLLSAWASWHKTRRFDRRGTHALWRDPFDFAMQFDRHLPVRTWCFSGWLAAAQLAPFGTSIPTILCYLDSAVYDMEASRFFSEAGIRPVEEGARLEFVRADAHLLRLSHSGAIPLAPPVRVYGDLVRLGGRGEAAAQHLRESRIGF